MSNNLLIGYMTNKMQRIFQKKNTQDAKKNRVRGTTQKEKFYKNCHKLNIRKS